MTRWLWLGVWALSCQKPAPSEDPKVEQPAASVVARPVESALAPPPAEAPVATAPKAAPLTPEERVRTDKLERLVRTSDGDMTAQLAGGGRSQAVVATKSAPLAPATLAIFSAVGALVSPETRAPAALRSLSLRELLAAAQDPATQRWLSENTRVLADGTVDVCLLLTPTRDLRRVELSALAPGSPAHAWEAQLVSATPPAETARGLLAAYQGVLALDVLLHNQERREVAFDEVSGRLLTLRGNGAFTITPAVGAVTDGHNRLSRHVVFSRRLHERLRALTRPELESRLAGPRGGLLLTPKQIDALLARRDALLRVIDGRVKRKGEAGTLVLP